MAIQKIVQRGALFNVGLEVAVVKEDSFFTAFCPALDLTAYGSSVSESLDMFKDAVQIFVEDAMKKKNLNEQLLQLGWTLKKKPDVNFEPPYIPIGMMRGYDVVREKKIRVSLPV
jgi:hypothetical protein